MVVRVKANQLKRNLYRRNTTTSKNIRLLRIITGKRQQEVADHLHLSRSAYYSMETGRKPPDFEMLSVLSEYYNVNMDYLLSFDIAEQMLNMLRVDQGEINAINFIERYSALSRTGKEHVQKEIMKIRKYEKKYNKFPWDYGNLKERIDNDDY